jgi:NADH-quinone oxidoreductase subunit H
MELELVLEKSVLVLVVFVITLAIAAYSTLAERKVAGFMQSRYGPDRAGPAGILQPSQSLIYSRTDHRHHYFLN